MREPGKRVHARIVTGAACASRRRAAEGVLGICMLLGNLLLLLPSTTAGAVSEAGVGVSNGLAFLRQQMDQYHDALYVYRDRNAGGNTFIPGGWMGDYGDIGFDAGWTNDPAEGPTCIRLTYSAAATQSNGWCGVYWLSSDKNWGDAGPGYDLSGATRLRFAARGENGGEKVVFKVGGVNWPSHHSVQYAYRDSCEPVTIGPVTLGTKWTEYEIDLSTSELFSLYTDYGSASDHFIPSAWYNGASNMWVDAACPDLPHSGTTCVKVTWDGTAGADGCKWNGLGWEWPEGRIAHPGEDADGFDLSGATELRLWARADAPDVELKLVIGHGEDSCGEISVEFVAVPMDWTALSIPIPAGTDMSNVTVGFGVFFNDEHPAGGDGCSFYLDDVEFDRPLQKDTSSLIGGFCWVTDTNMNAGGCTLYLDSIEYDKPRLDEPRFLQSYVMLRGTNEYVLNNGATTYDNALALMAFTLAGDTDSVRRAGLLADAFVSAMTDDPDYGDGRVRNSYRSGGLVDPFSGAVLLPGWWDADEQLWREDDEAVGSKVGDVAWAGLGLLMYARATGQTNYMAAVSDLGAWIVSNTWDDSGPGGFMGGFWGWTNGVENVDWGWYRWKSTEHNLDAWRLFEGLYAATGDPQWTNAAAHARGFVEAMWDPGEGFFHTGTTNATDTDTALRALDPNSWGVLAFWPGSPEYRRALAWADAHCLTSDAGFVGFDFNDDRDGVWFEGTAQMVLAYLYGGRGEDGVEFLRELRCAQSSAPNADGLGIVAACRDALSTGLDWCYDARLHVGATCWYLFAEYGFNPFRDTVVPRIAEAGGRGSGFGLKWVSPAGSTCVVQTCDCLLGSWTNREVLAPDTFETTWTDEAPSSRCFYRILLNR